MIGIIVIIVPLLYYCMLSLPFSDDFANARHARDQFLKSGSYITASVDYTKYLWLNWQGTFAGIIPMLWFNAYYRWGLTGLRITNTVGTGLFFAALINLVRVFCKPSKYRLSLTLWISFILLLCMVNNQMYSEIYTWNTCIYIYIIPCIFMLLAETEHIEYIRNQKSEWIIASICGFIAGGGPINMATLACGLCLFTTAYGLVWLGVKIHIRAFAPFIASILGTLLNVLAPGNFVRWGEGEKLSIIRVAYVSFLYVFKRIWDLSTRTPYILVMIVLFLAVHQYATFSLNNRLSYKHPVFLAALFLISCAVVYFPYLLGVRVQNLDFVVENRALFVEDLGIYLLSTVWVFYLAGFVRQKFPKLIFDDSHYLIIVAICSLFIFMFYGYGLHDEFATPYMIRTIVDGSARDFADYQENIINEIAENKDENVAVVYDLSHYPIRNKMIIGLWLSDDPDRWDYYNNRTIAAYYGKDTVDVEYIYD